MLDDDFNSAFWDNLQEEMKKVSESDVDPSQLWIDEFNSYYNTTTKVNILNFNNKISVFQIWSSYSIRIK